MVLCMGFFCELLIFCYVVLYNEGNGLWIVVVDESVVWVVVIEEGLCDVDLLDVIVFIDCCGIVVRFEILFFDVVLINLVNLYCDELEELFVLFKVMVWFVVMFVD